MFRFLTFIIATLCLIIVTGASLSAMDPETVKIMPFVNDASYCEKCHTKSEAKEFKGETIYSCFDYCQTCHDTHHSVGKRVSRNRPKNLKYFKRNKVACFTCHELDRPRFDSKSWKSESLYERVFDSKNKYSTYYLPVNNRQGELCKQCH